MEKLFSLKYWKNKKGKIWKKKEEFFSSIGFNARELEEYRNEVIDAAKNDVQNNPDFTKETSINLQGMNLSIKPIAFYLPQFHPFPENDEWWGKGFTEWTNVTKAKPQYLGQYQPQLPIDLGFYDLRVSDVMYKQAAMARKYGIFGFCFYSYWFAGKKLMNTPLDMFLADKTIDMNFCLCWANENWTRRWDGQEHEILIKQEHSPSDDVAYIESLLPFFLDERYIRIDGKPLFLIYNPALLPDAKETVKRWRTYIKEKGLSGLYVVSVQSFDKEPPGKYGCDAAVEFPPNQGNRIIDWDAKIVNPHFEGKIYQYKEIMNSYLEEYNHSESYEKFRSILVSWDNEARRPGKGISYRGGTPRLYEEWLEKAAEKTLKDNPQKRFLFINAWNEWAEGNHLEPCRRFGYAYLEKTARILEKYKI